MINPSELEREEGVYTIWPGRGRKGNAGTVPLEESISIYAEGMCRTCCTIDVASLSRVSPLSRTFLSSLKAVLNIAAIAIACAFPCAFSFFSLPLPHIGRLCWPGPYHLHMHPLGKPQPQ